MKVNPIFYGRDFIVQENLCFVLLPLHDPFTLFFEDHIKPVVAGCGLTAIKADDIRSNKSIMEDVWKHLNQARLVLADITGSNPNVFYELGIAHTLGKEVILMTQDTGKVPFDVGHVRHIRYDLSPAIKLFDVALQETIDEVLRGSKSAQQATTFEESTKEKISVPPTSARHQRISELTKWARGWVNANFKQLTHSKDLDVKYEWQIFDDIEVGIGDEAKRRWSLSSGTVKDYVDNVMLTINPEFNKRILEAVEMQKERERVMASRQERRRVTALQTMVSLELVPYNSIEKSVLTDTLLKTGEFDITDVKNTIADLTQRGLIYETKSGFYVRNPRRS